MENDATKDATSPAPAAAIEVRFRLPPESGAEHAWVAGEFNDWSTESNPLERRTDGGLEAVIPLRPGRYRFRFYLGDGRWENAWDAEAYADNEFGGADSVVIVRATSNGDAPGAPRH